MPTKYKIKPEKGKFLEFAKELGLSKDELISLERITLDEVEIDETAKTWSINGFSQEAEKDNIILAGVAQKLALACSLVKVNFVLQDKETIAEDVCQSPAYLAALNRVKGTTLSAKGEGVAYGKKVTKSPRPIHDVQEEENNVVLTGKIVAYKERELRTGSVMLSILIVDDNDGITAKIRFGDGKNAQDLPKNIEEYKKFCKQLPIGSHIVIQGNVAPDKFEKNEIVMTFVKGIMLKKTQERMDNAPQKRVELHCHTKMSRMDGITPIKELVRTAIKWGHKALAITDHGVVQAFPFAYDEAKGKDIKLIYGVEGYLCASRESKKSYHIIVLARTVEGLRNLYRLISLSHLQYFGGGRAKRPRMTKALLEQYKAGLLLGSACSAGELYQGIINGASHEELLEIAKFYDYLEIQPIGNNRYLLADERYPNIKTEEDLQKINKKIIALAEEMGKLVVATCDVHFLKPEDALARRILQVGQDYPDEEQPPVFFRTTEEMLGEFQYLGKDKAFELVVTNTNKISDTIESFKPVPDRDQLYSPVIPGAEDKVKNLTYARAHELYGPNLNEKVTARLKQELDAIIGNGFAVLYYIAHLLVKKSNDDGYMVGSRGSVGSSFVATMLNITEVNPLEPHYRCPKCFRTEFITDGSVGSGFDLPEKNCPECGAPMVRDGHNIPFAVFLGFHGEKVPDIDLNFSGEYQPKAHKYTEELFGRDNVCRAGTLSNIKDRTAYGFVKKYFEKKNIKVRNAYIEGLIPSLVGVKRTTGQHPGGIVVIPRDLDIQYITPIQYPADKEDAGTTTTHFDFHSIDERIVKLDILGHDDPTMIKMLDSLIGEDGYCKAIPIGDPDTMELFLSTKSLQVTPEDIGSEVGTYGVPECGTKFVRQMISDVKPKNFSDLLKISGYSHGTDVWLNNAQDLIKEGKPTEDTISTRDDIMISLIRYGMEPSMAFKIMEWCRKGKAAKGGFTPEQAEALEKAKIPEFYVKSCRTVQYLFPKAHAVAYVLSAYRIAYCKVHHPKEFYAAYFTVRAPNFDYTIVRQGKDYMKKFIKNVYSQGTDASTNDQDIVTYLELAVEMLERGYIFEDIDIYKSDAHKFQVTEKGLRVPLGAISGMGGVAAEGLAEARKRGTFISREDLKNRSKISSAAVEALVTVGSLEGMPATDQIELF